MPQVREVARITLTPQTREALKRGVEAIKEALRRIGEWIRKVSEALARDLRALNARLEVAAERRRARAVPKVNAYNVAPMPSAETLASRAVVPLRDYQRRRL